ncbi:hypothetical protein IQ258_30060 [Coleofasciculus sp. LEGE 07081]|nr:hypothetical protein [Coleofasciculus sp. LEGE 07081]
MALAQSEQVGRVEGLSVTESAESVQVEISKDIRSIFQDADGNYWFGSSDLGLYKYDRKKVVRYSTENGLPSNRITNIQSDKSGTLFLNTGKGIGKFEDGKFTPIPVNKGKDGGNEWKLEKDDLWFAGRDAEGGVYRYDGESLHFLTFPKHKLHDEYFSQSPNRSYSPYDVYTIYKDKGGNMWFGTTNFGVCRFDGTSLNWLYEKHLTETPEGGSFGIRSVIEDKDGKFWICNTRYRFALDKSGFAPKSGEELKYSREPGLKDDFGYFLSAVESDDGDLWMVGEFGVWRFGGKQIKKYPVKDGEDDAFVYAIYKDNVGGMWLSATAGRREVGAGLYRFNGEGFEKFVPSKS